MKILQLSNLPQEGQYLESPIVLNDIPRWEIKKDIPARNVNLQIGHMYYMAFPSIDHTNQDQDQVRAQSNSEWVPVIYMGNGEDYDDDCSNTKEFFWQPGRNMNEIKEIEPMSCEYVDKYVLFICMSVILSNINN